MPPIAREPQEEEPLIPRHVEYYRLARDFALGVHPLSKYAVPILLLTDALLTSLIISKVACMFASTRDHQPCTDSMVDTEIDWKAYMEQMHQIVNGERDYTLIKGGTGPLVYPAAHVYIYWVLYKITDEGRNILLAQRLFGVLYLGTMALVMACYRRARVS